MRMARAELLAKSNTNREEEAAFIFYKYDSTRSGDMDADELARCFTDLGFCTGRQNKSDDEMKEWVRRELKKANKKGDGKLTVR